MDCSYKNARTLLDELIALRKKAPQEISEIYAKRNKEMLKNLKDVKIDLHNNYDFTYNTEIQNPFENLQIKQDELLLEKIYEQIQVLQVLVKKKNCPISNIIDNI